MNDSCLNIKRTTQKMYMEGWQKDFEKFGVYNNKPSTRQFGRNTWKNSDCIK